MNISTWLKNAAETLKRSNISSSKLDAELILSNTLRKDRTFLHAHPDEKIDPRRVDIADARLMLRLDRTPLAYILGYRDFYGREFKVSPQVLIPRPESEVIIEILKEIQVSGKLLDVGTGSGCLGITAKLEIPELSVILSDISQKALRVASENAAKFNADVALIESDLLRSVPGKFDIITANLPYVDRSWQRSPETNHEPELALFADNEGLALIYRLIDQLPCHLSSGSLVLIEADLRQHGAIIAYAASRQLHHKLTRGLSIVLQS